MAFRVGLLLLLLVLSAFVVFADETGEVADDVKVDISDSEDSEETYEDDDAFAEDEMSQQDMPPMDEMPGGMPEDFDPRTMIRLNPFVIAKAHFPNNKDSRFTLGTKADVTVGMLNTGEETYRIVRVGAYLHSAYDWTYHIQNLTHLEPRAELNPLEQITLTYSFTPDKGLEAINYRLGGFVDFNSTLDESMYRSYFANITIELADEETELNASTIFTYTLVFAIVGAFAYLGLAVAGSNSKLQLPGMKKTHSEVSSATWDDVVAYQPSSSKGAAKKRKR
jgi:hypothetical protein